MSLVVSSRLSLCDCLFVCVVCLVFISVTNLSLNNYFSVYAIGGQHDGHCLSGYLPALVIIIFVLYVQCIVCCWRNKYTTTTTLKAMWNSNCDNTIRLRSISKC